jgi:hypothetical protein
VGVKWRALDFAFFNLVMRPSNVVAGKSRSALCREVQAPCAKN